MTGSSARRRLARFRLTGAAVAAILVLPGSGLAQTTNTSGACAEIQDCQTQQQSPVTYKKSQTKGWAYYCTGDHPYFWGKDYANLSGRWVQTNKCFTTTENAGAENGDPGKLDVTVTNWCAKQEDYNITLACSTVPPPLWNESCTSTDTSETVEHDPSCPTVPGSSRKLTRSAGGVPIPMEIWVEQCNANLYWNCSSDTILLQCSSCGGKSN